MPRRIPEQFPSGALPVESGERTDPAEPTLEPYVRVCVMSSFSATDVFRLMIQKKIEPRDFSFTNVLFVEKDGRSENAGQAVPIGGSVGEDEDALKAVGRHLLEKTHIRPINVRLLGDMPYTLHRKKEKRDKLVRARYFSANVLPSDIPIPLHPEDDKIMGFHRLDIQDVGTLLGEGEIRTRSHPSRGRILPLLDSLRMDESVDHATSAVDYAPKDAENIQFEIVKDIRAHEAKKKIDVIMKLLIVSPLPDETKKLFQQRIEDARIKGDVSEIQELYVNVVDAVSESNFLSVPFHELFLEAVDLSNFQEEVDDESAGSSRIEATVRFMLTLLETKFSSNAYLDIAEKNEKLKDLVQKIKHFLRIISSDAKGGRGGEQHSMERQSASMAEFGGDEGDALLADAFEESFDIDERWANRVFTSTNTMIDDLSRKNIITITDGAYAANVVEQYNEVRDASLPYLLRLAFPRKKKSENHHFVKEGQHRERAVFEARRKLALLVTLSEGRRFYEETIENGVAPIQSDVWNAIVKPTPPDVQMGSRFDDRGELIDVDVVNEGDAKEHAHVWRTRLRQVVRDDGSVAPYLVEEITDQKRLEAVFRKMLIRGFDDPHEIKDVFRRQFIFQPGDGNGSAHGAERIFPKKEATIELCTESADGVRCEQRLIEDMAPVVDMLLSIQAKAERLKTQGVSIHIVDFKPTDGGMKSNSPGGGGDIRLAKWYVRHKDKKGVVRYQEVQAFTPSDDGKSGFYWAQKKKSDDERYALDRLIFTKGLRSFIELMWPAKLYASTRDVARNRRRKRPKKK